MPKNRERLIKAIEGKWTHVLEKKYVEKTCSSAWERLRRIVATDGGYAERIRTAQTSKDDNDNADENNNAI